MIRFPLASLLAALFLALPLQIYAAESAFFKSADREYALLGGYGITHRGFGETVTQVQTIDLIARLGLFLSDEAGQGWYKGRHQLLLELPVHLAPDQNRIMTGGYILGSWKFTSPENVVPYIFAGGGILYANLGLQSMGSRLNFSYQGGSGIQYFIAKDTALNLEYRYHHISNADTASPNEPLNSSKVLLGISVFR